MSEKPPSRKEPHAASKQARPLALRWPGRAAAALAFLGGVFLYAWLAVEPALRYHSSAPVFYLDADFLRAFLKRPGGLLRYAANFGAQWDCWPVAGAALLTGMVGLLGWASWGCLRTTGCRPSWVYGLPSLLLLALANDYSFPVLETGGSALLALGSLAAWLAWRPASRWTRLALFWGMAAVSLYVGGAPCFLLFVVVGTGCAAIAHCGWRTVGGCALTLALLPIGAACFPEVSFTSPFRRWGAGLPLALAVAFNVISGGAVLLGTWLARLGRCDLDHDAAPRSEGATTANAGALRAAAAPTWLWAALLASAALGLGLSVKPRAKALVRIQRDAGEQRWDRVLKTAAALRNYPASARLQVHRALFHTGRLASDLFAYPQVSGVDLLPGFEAGLDVCEPLSDTLLELGQLNLAEHYAHEALEVQGERPLILRRIARINVLKGRPQAARVFLNRLARVPFHREWAGRYLRALETDAVWTDDTDLARLRPLVVKTELTEMRFPTQAVLEQAMASAPKNRAAFEYLTAHFLLTRQTDAVAGNLPRYKEMEHAELPRHVEEAVLMCQHLHGSSTNALGGWPVRPETARRFAHFLELVSRNPGATATNDAALVREFGDTYWFYGQFGRTY